MRNVYLALSILGFVAPYYFFLQIPAEEALDLPSLLQPLFATALLRGISMDLFVSVIAFWLFVFAESNRLSLRNPWVYVLATLLVGLSFALPLFLYFREKALERR